MQMWTPAGLLIANEHENLAPASGARVEFLPGSLRTNEHGNVAPVSGARGEGFPGSLGSGIVRNLKQGK